MLSSGTLSVVLKVPGVPDPIYKQQSEFTCFISSQLWCCHLAPCQLSWRSPVYQTLSTNSSLNLHVMTWNKQNLIYSVHSNQEVSNCILRDRPIMIVGWGLGQNKKDGPENVPRKKLTRGCPRKKIDRASTSAQAPPLINGPSLTTKM